MSYEFTANGKPVRKANATLHLAGGGSGTFSTTHTTAFRPGDHVTVSDNAGNALYGGTVTTVSHNSTETEVIWTATTGGVWMDLDMKNWPAADIIDHFAKELAERRPA